MKTGLNSPSKKETLPRWLTGVVIHLIFWLSYLLYDTVSFGSILGDFPIAFKRSCLHGIILAIMVYVNLHIFYPYIFKKRKIISYLAVSIFFGIGVFFGRVQLDISLCTHIFEKEGKFYEPAKAQTILWNLIEIESYSDAAFRIEEITLTEAEDKKLRSSLNYATSGIKDTVLLKKYFYLNIVEDRILKEKPYKHIREYAWFYLIGMLFGTAIVYGMFGIIRLLMDSYMKHENEQLYFRAENLRLKTQLNQHFLFNALGSIFHRFQHIEDDLGQELTQNLKWMMQYAIEKCENNQSVSLEDELTLAQKYIFFHSFLAGKIKLQKPDESYQKIGVMPMLLNPILENVIKHGNLNDENSFLDLQIELSEESIRFNISNSTSARTFSPTRTLISSFGIGLKNLRNRLDLFYKDADSYVFTYGKAKDENIYVVELEVPIIFQE